MKQKIPDELRPGSQLNKYCTYCFTTEITLCVFAPVNIT